MTHREARFIGILMVGGGLAAIAGEVYDFKINGLIAALVFGAGIVFYVRGVVGEEIRKHHEDTKPNLIK